MLIANRKKIFLLTTIILLVLFLAFPFYIWSSDISQASLKTIVYFLAIICSLIVFPFELKSIKKTILWCVLINLSIISAILIQNMLYVDFTTERASQSYLIACSYSWLGFVIGRFMISNMNFPDLKTVNISINTLIWLSNCYFIFSKTNWDLMQAAYGEDDPSFSGSYQYIGDSFSFISIILLSQLVGRNDRINKNESLICCMFMLISSIFCFLNGSRASFFSLIAVFFLVINILFSSSQKMIATGAVIILGIAIFLIPNNSFLNIDMSAVLENRNLELVSNGGESSSLEDRDKIKNEGVMSILQNPFLGSYTEMNRFAQGGGNYIHSILGLWHYFGVIPFVSYTLVMVECSMTFIGAFKLLSLSELIFYGGSLFFCTISVLFFRMPISFFSMFIVFGIFSTFNNRKDFKLDSKKYGV
jgi:hypothetical protein